MRSTPSEAPSRCGPAQTRARELAPMSDTPAVLWRPDPASVEASQMRVFQRLMGERHDAPQGDYAEFWRWTIDRLDDFWEEIIAFAGVVWERGDGPVRGGETMPDVRWFPGARINYAENILRCSEEVWAEQT